MSLEKPLSFDVRERSFTVLSDTPTLRDNDSAPPQIVVEKKQRSTTGIQDTPLFSEESSGVIVPEEFNEQAIRRMEWIMQGAMDTLLPTLRPEQRKLIDGATDLRQLVIPLFNSWREFRSAEGRTGKSSKTAMSLVNKFRKIYTNNELFETFWRRKAAAENDEASWGGFETVVRNVLEQVGLIDRVIGGMGNVRP